MSEDRFQTRTVALTRSVTRSVKCLCFCQLQSLCESATQDWHLLHVEEEHDVNTYACL
jgi:hypothetical protein